MSSTQSHPAASEALDSLREKLAEAEATLEAIRTGAIDALLVMTPEGERVFVLQGSEHPYRVFVERMQQAAVTVGPDGTILFCNAALATLVDGEVTRLTGSRLGDHVTPESRPALERLLSAAASEDAACTLELAAPGRAPRAVHAGARSLFGGMLAVVLTDLTEQLELALANARTEALRENERRFRAIAEAVPDFVFLARDDARTEYMSPGFFAITGLPVPAKLEGLEWQHAFPPEEVTAIESAWRAGVRGEAPFVIETRIRRADGELRWVRCRCHPLRAGDGTIAQWFGVGMDIDDEKRASERLETQVRERTSEYQQTNKQLMQFTETVSHDLRAPVRTIHNVLDALVEEIGPTLTGEGRACVNRIQGATRHLDQLIRDLLEYSRVSREELTGGLVVIEDCVMAALAQFEADVAERRARIALDDLRHVPPVLAHAATLTQAIANLVANALRFTRPGEPPEILIRLESEPDVVRLWVEDRGIGIASEFHDRIFRMFETLHPRDRYGGSGIGLAVVRQSVERMGGAVGLESLPGHGSRFWIELPTAERRTRPRG